MRTPVRKLQLAVCLFLAGMLCVVFSLPSHAAAGAGDVSRGNALFKEGRFKKAVESYETAEQKNPTAAAIDYDLGAAYYKDGAFDKAVEHFQKSLLADDDHLRRDAHFNLSNALYKSGIAHENDDISAAISGLEQAVGNYEKALSLDSKDVDAASNRDFVKKELERLKKKQQDMKQQQQDQQQQNQQQENKDQKNTPQDQQQSGEKNKQDQRNSVQNQGQGQKNEVPENKNEQEQKPSGGQEGEKGKKSEGEKAQQEQGQPAKEESSRKQQQQSSTAGQESDGQVLSKDEARAALDDFDQNDQPKGLLNFIREKHDTRPVDKDW